MCVLIYVKIVFIKNMIYYFLFYFINNRKSTCYSCVHYICFTAFLKYKICNNLIISFYKDNIKINKISVILFTKLFAWKLNSHRNNESEPFDLMITSIVTCPLSLLSIHFLLHFSRSKSRVHKSSWTPTFFHSLSYKKICIFLHWISFTI